MKLKHYIPTSLEHLWIPIVRCIAFLGLVIALMAGNAQAMQESYGVNQCELIAKDFQKEFGGSLVWIQPLKDNGAFDLGDYNAHIINKVYFSGVGIVYIDYYSGMNMESIDEVQAWYGKPARIYDLSIERPEFGMIWWY